MPTNVYGPGDNFDLDTGHVLAALGPQGPRGPAATGAPPSPFGALARPGREFLYSDDLADAAVYLMNLPAELFRVACHRDPPALNLGCGEDLTIDELADVVMQTLGYRAGVVYEHLQARWHAAQTAGCQSRALAGMDGTARRCARGSRCTTGHFWKRGSYSIRTSAGRGMPRCPNRIMPSAPIPYTVRFTISPLA